MEAADVNTPADDGSPGRAGYRRSAGSPRGEASSRPGPDVASTANGAASMKAR